MTTIPLAEDAPVLANVLSYNLRRAGYTVRTAADGAEALAVARRSHPDLVLLDLLLPGVDGLEVCRRLRESDDDRLRTAPVLMCSARRDVVDRVVGLEAGADDHVGKPFALRELLARVAALLLRGRREPAPPDTPPGVQAAGDLVLDVAGRTLRRGGREVGLKPREFDLLHFLLRHPRRVFTRSQLLAQVCPAGEGGATFAGSERTVDVHVRGLREKLEADPSAPAVLQTVWGVGYRVRPS
jgi:DNA-binding response OmpR family regulator